MSSSLFEGERRRRRHWEWLLLLLVLLMSFVCVSFSTRLAVRKPPGRLASGAMLAMSQADYGQSSIEDARFAPLNPDLRAEAATDTAMLYATSRAAAPGAPPAIAFLPHTPTPSRPSTLDPFPTPAASLTVVPSASPATPASVVSASPSPNLPTATATQAAGTPTASATATGVASPTPTPSTPAPSTPTATATSLATATATPVPTQTPSDPPPTATFTPIPPPPSDDTESPPSPTPTNTPIPVNGPPLAVDDSAITDEDTPVTISVLANDTDPDLNLDVDSVLTVTLPLSGTLGTSTTGEITYTPNAHVNGLDVFGYQVCDTGTPILCDTATVTVTIAPVNDAPVANDDVMTTNPNTPVPVVVLANDTDVDGNLDVTSVTTVTNPTSGTLSIDPAGVITYTPVTGFVGMEDFAYQVCDTGTPILCDTATVTVTVPIINLALGQPAQVSSYHNDNQMGDKATDGLIETLWRPEVGSSLPSQWIKVDLGSSLSISQVVLRWGNSYATSFIVQVSQDNINWTPVFTTTSGNGDIDTVTFSPTLARYVRMDATAWSGEPWSGWLREFEVYP